MSKQNVEMHNRLIKLGVTEKQMTAMWNQLLYSEFGPVVAAVEDGLNWTDLDLEAMSSVVEVSKELTKQNYYYSIADARKIWALSSI